MGNYCSCFQTNTSNHTKIALKFPHGKLGIFYNPETKKFEALTDINIWIESLYKDKNWSNWMIYNDECNFEKSKKQGTTTLHVTHGHCKGIVAWNDETISWLCHSVPNFPSEFSVNTISSIEKSELIYGQSFQYVEIPFETDKLIMIAQQLMIMDACIYQQKIQVSFPKKQHKTTNTIDICSGIIHIAKSPSFHIDIYSECIAERYRSQWSVETWIRGHHITKQCTMITDIKYIEYENINYKESQDHSKWAVSSDDYYWIGDLNRMTSQYSRGGGGFLCTDKNIALAFRSLIRGVPSPHDGVVKGVPSPHDGVVKDHNLRGVPPAHDGDDSQI
jgi:hypothetical protein